MFRFHLNTRWRLPKLNFLSGSYNAFVRHENVVSAPRKTYFCTFWWLMYARVVSKSDVINKSVFLSGSYNAFVRHKNVVSAPRKTYFCTFWWLMYARVVSKSDVINKSVSVKPFLLRIAFLMQDLAVETEKFRKHS